jgi:trehalose synthase
VLQLSIREGFGLTVAEALWAGTPVIGGETGGIPLQLEHGRTGYLVDSPEEAAKYIVDLVRNPNNAAKMGKAGREAVRRRFLLPRLIRDELRLWVSLVDGKKGKRVAQAGKPSGRGRSAPARRRESKKGRDHGPLNRGA